MNIRNLNEGIEVRKREFFEKYLNRKYSGYTLQSIEDYDNWKESDDAKSKSQSQFVKERLMRNVDMFSNGETAMSYYMERIDRDALYLIDEPENSLSPKRQLELMEYIATSARYYHCQFVLSTHSLFLLSLPDAKIIDLDTYPVTERKWTELENVQTYYEFFKRHQIELEGARIQNDKENDF